MLTSEWYGFLTFSTSGLPNDSGGRPAADGLGPKKICTRAVTLPQKASFHRRICPQPLTTSCLNSLTDNALMLQVKAGQVDKMGLLFERYHRPLFGFFYHLTGNAEASEDLVQTAFYRMLKYRHTYTGEGEFRTWMYHLARNAAADASLQRAQDVDLLHQAMGRLSAEQREVLVLSRFQELKYEQIAQLLNTTEGAVKVRVHRALNQLKGIYLKLENGIKSF